MKRFFTMLVAVLMCATMFAKSEKQTVVFDVDLHCQGCVSKIEKNIAFEKGVRDLICDLGKKQVTVVFDPTKNSVTNLQTAFEKLGKPAKVNKAATEEAVRKSTGKKIDATTGATLKK